MKPKKLSFRVSEEEYNTIKNNAEKAELKISEYLRKISTDEKIIKIDLSALIIELGRIGNNINQIAKQVNQGLLSDTGNIKEYKDNFNKIYEKVKDLSKIIKG